MKIPVSDKSKIYKCPSCKIKINNFKDLQLKSLYECTACHNNFFVELTPKYFFTIASK
jgi:DNA-directed RNA polymerase subunit RPC12/RpoP